MSIEVVILLVWLHFISDFLFQTDFVALNKSKNNWVLLAHIILYSTLFSIFISPVYGVLNGALHFVVDWATSRLGAYFWEKGNRDAFFDTIGFDQAVHITCLFMTYIWFVL